ncbi:hypothetical protein [Enterobacter hormaechei]|uniref:hypothetical protein n=1 Tax=Enterobacter hormaechei TaxID=158836 RepID=UPI0020757285|nr:hypothetical protein [Enterobacter hormaechei]EKS6383367.1 hypothetical protein [Enterobacter hormaechei]ELD3291317.1 hypothetical protein [Enterobacter hormaechei]ELD3429873.1 hypothetical protein [Enterobacter hormaechei]MCM7436320.1 hypothetical protein [Enterobacter hormaechei]
MTNISAVEKMAESMQQMEESSPRVAALQYCLKQVAEKVEEAEKRNSELEARCAALAAENAGLKAFGDKLNEMHNDLNGEGTGIQGRAEVACQQVALEAAMEEFDAIKTPATDAFLAEVRAQARADGVQEYADSFRHSASKIRECHGDTIRVRALLHEATNADEFAAQLRKGVQS